MPERHIVNPYDWTAEEGEPFVIEAPALPPPYPPQKCTCARAAVGNNPLCFAPHSIVDISRLAQQIKDDTRVPCILLKISALFQDYPQPMLQNIESDVADWGEHAAKLANKPVNFYVEKAQFPCGDKPCCLTHPRSVVEEELENYKSILGLSYKIDSAVAQAYPDYIPRDIAILIAWFTYNKPTSDNHAIRDKDVAAMFGVSTRTVRRIREKALNDNPKAFNSFLYARYVVKETRGYEVRQ